MNTNTKNAKQIRIAVEAALVLLVALILNMGIMSSEAFAETISDGLADEQPAVVADGEDVSEPADVDGQGDEVVPVPDAVEQNVDGGEVVEVPVVEADEPAEQPIEKPAERPAVAADAEVADAEGVDTTSDVVGAPKQQAAAIENAASPREAAPVAQAVATQESAANEIRVSNASELKTAVSNLNTNGGSAVVVMDNDIVLSKNDGALSLGQGELTLLGAGHKLTAHFQLMGSAILNLGMEAYSESIQLEPVPSSGFASVFDLTGASVLNIYDGVKIGPSFCTAVVARGQSTANMLGGSISDCRSVLVSGGVFLENSATFNLRGGSITGCSGNRGGAVGFSDQESARGSAAAPATFNMYGGAIGNCHDHLYGGGAVCVYSNNPAAFNMYGGTIENCDSSEGFGNGGAICISTSGVATVLIDGGTITGCSIIESRDSFGGAMMIRVESGSDVQLRSGTITGNSAAHGGGIYVAKGKVVIADGFKLYGNVASTSGDDIYNAGGNENVDGGHLNLGAADTTASLDCGHAVTGWFEDGDERWNYAKCSGVGQNHLVPFTGAEVSGAMGLKAAHGVPVYTVSFNTVGAGSVADQAIEDGKTVTKPADPTRSGYTFGGWTLNGAQYNFGSAVERDITLVAKWTPVAAESEEPAATPGSTSGSGSGSNASSSGTATSAASSSEPAAPAAAAADEPVAAVYAAPAAPAIAAVAATPVAVVEAAVPAATTPVAATAIADDANPLAQGIAGEDVAADAVVNGSNTWLLLALICVAAAAFLLIVRLIAILRTKRDKNDGLA